MIVLGKSLSFHFLDIYRFNATPHLPSCLSLHQGWLRIRGHLHCLRGDGSACGEGADRTSKCAKLRESSEYQESKELHGGFQKLPLCS